MYCELSQNITLLIQASWLKVVVIHFVNDIPSNPGTVLNIKI